VKRFRVVGPSPIGAVLKAVAHPRGGEGRSRTAVLERVHQLQPGLPGLLTRACRRRILRQALLNLPAMPDLAQYTLSLAENAREASRELVAAVGGKKNAWL